MFRTELSIAPATDQLARTARVLTMGSCFADSIGSRLLANKVDALVNPFGTVFQPLALAQLLRAAAGEDVDWQQHIVEARGRWQSYDLHGSIGAESPVELLQHIQELVRRTSEYVRNADVVLLTLGTAWAYRLRETGELVNNCHKQPADLFVRELLTPDEIINALAETHAYLRRINPKVRFVLTVSPVRHLKETLQLNAVSKSVLRVATHIVSDLLPGVAYFPAYELLVDDLRDYRFYAADMLHPSEVAEDYIWEKFARAYFDADFGRFRKEWASVRQSLGHRPLHAGAPEHRQFLESTLQKLEQLSLRRVEVSDELRTVRTQLAALPEPRQPELVAELEDDEERIDIGEGSQVSAVERSSSDATEVARAADATLAAATQPASSENRPRLSPEEFRAQRGQRPERGRRDGRGRNRQGQPTENEQFQTAAFAGETADAPVIVPEARAEAVAALEANLMELAPAPLAADLVAGADTAANAEPAKKKKRRSRGGAKRTARKHALRLAAEAENQALSSAMPGDDSAEPDSPAAAAAVGQPSETTEPKKSSVIVKSVPVKRGGRRGPLFAAPLEPSAETTAPVDAALPLPTPAIPPLEIPAVSNEPSPAPLASEANAPATRNSRNRKKKNAAKANPAMGTAAPAAEVTENEAPTPAVGSAVIETTRQPAGEEVAPAIASNELAQTESPVSAINADVTPSGDGNTPARRSPRRAKARAISGARTEKPAVDTPVVPVPDASQVRTQVAAGRMKGSSASLVAPAAPLETPDAATNANPTKAEPKMKAAKKPTATKPKAKPAPLAPLPEIVEATLEIAPPVSAASAAPEPKPAARAKKAPKAPVKAPAKPKAAKTGTNNEKQAAKPKAARKPAKSAE
ncbi:GSCFA domain-containing protein [Hymenobacter properus]|uniref:GSCFA domain-containing protein n=1 Tax=Hymenobacter properus TaxID=2791026 RepID=A0A931BMI6_9BACT|nr:GSCFA domain-containing protein [Hymenobacter properus]MBF9142165.1 GSCFA domain-containing protein [Hymenobacter properus]MBR7720972.1 GSCFA domain-containing protein [Microvirga sp. SRT04]